MIEINLIGLLKAERGTKKEWKTVTRDGKTFRQRFATGEKESFKDIKEHRDIQEFMRTSIGELKEHGIKGKDLDDFYNNTRLKRFTCQELSKKSAISAIENNIRDSVHTGWFRNEDKGMKQHLYNAIVNNDETRSAGLKVMYDTYVVQNDSKLSFKEFLNTDVTLYRGGDVTDDIFTSFSMDRHMAEKFGDKITEIKVKPIQTLGSYQTIAEAEVLIPKKLLEDIK
jgi:hypothetical protein